MGKTEQWKVIEGFDLYEISNTGKIRNQKGKILKPVDNGKGYLKFELKNDGRNKREYVHRLVAIFRFKDFETARSVSAYPVR